ncbi:hypothetical protein GCM10010515_53720 [Streptomyces fructofermentans]|uniref:Uncharacterized protein n=1 Tax=Streptomyces fructofermentans TaxID=152141 RepID=A0A918NLN3_9ACTN|nr:hypothetical protein GCM10010515_53720 [Streptomyces fructofermentans]
MEPREKDDEGLVDPTAGRPHALTADGDGRTRTQDKAGRERTGCLSHERHPVRRTGPDGSACGEAPEPAARRNGTSGATAAHLQQHPSVGQEDAAACELARVPAKDCGISGG